MIGLKEKLEKNILFIDELTQIFNRRFFERILPELLKQSKNSVFSIFDVDDFKKINDTYGHRTGDKVLEKVGESLKNFFKENNEFPIRYAGDEFAVVILNIEQGKAVKKIEEMFNTISSIEMKGNGKEIKISISCGISFFPEDGNLCDELLNKADEGLYYVKKRGKNNFVIYRNIAHKIEKEKILKGILSPKKILNLDEEKEIINAGVERNKGIFIISGKSGTGKTRLLKFAEKKCQENEFLNIICFTNKNDKTLPFNSILRGISLWMDEERTEILESKNLGEYLEYFTPYGNIKKEEVNVEEMFDFLEKFVRTFKVGFLIDDAENLDKYSSEFIDLYKEDSIFFLCVSDIKFLNSRLMEDSFLVSLSGISEDLVKTYVENILPGFITGEEFINWIKAVSNRNPFLIEEILRYLIEKEYITLSNGEYRLNKLNEIITLKPTLSEIVRERIKNLDRESKIFLYSLSIGERYFDIYTTAEYTGINPGRLNEIADKLSQKHFISNISENIYYFKNSMVKNMIYNSIEEKTKKKLHLRMAKTLENSRSQPQFLNSVEIAKHYNLAGNMEKAREIVNKVNSFLERIQKLPDLKRLKKLRRKSRLKEEIKFTPLKKEVFDVIDLFLKRFYGATEIVKIYPESSSIVEERTKETFELLRKILLIQKSLIMGVHSGKLIINETEMLENKVYIRKIKDLLEESKLESIIFTEGIDKESLKKFLLFTKKLKEFIAENESIEDAFDNMNLKGIHLNERIYIALGSDIGEIFEYEHVDLESSNRELTEAEIPPAPYKSETVPVELQKKDESLEENIRKYINDEEKVKEIIGKVLVKLNSNIIQNQKNSIKTIEKIFNEIPESIREYISEEMTSFYFEKALPDIKEYLKDKIFKYLKFLVFYNPDKLISYLNKEPLILIDNLQSSLNIIEHFEGKNKEKFEQLLIKAGVKEFKRFFERHKEGIEEHPVLDKIFETKLFETKGNIINEIKDDKFLIKLLEIIEKKQIPVKMDSLLNLYLNSSNKDVCIKIFKLMYLRKSENVIKYFEECIKRNKEKEIAKFLSSLTEISEKSFLSLLIKIIEKKKKFEKEPSYDIQLKTLKVLKNFDIEEIITELIEIANKESIFSLKRNKQDYFRLEILKLLAEHLKEKDNMELLKEFEKDKNVSIRSFIKSITR